jgi:hypothetical protein
MLPVLGSGWRTAIPEVTRPELTYEQGQPSVAPMWQWTRQRLLATAPRSRSGQAARVRQQNRVFCALRTLHLRERLVETESAVWSLFRPRLRRRINY